MIDNLVKRNKNRRLLQVDLNMGDHQCTLAVSKTGWEPITYQNNRWIILLYNPCDTINILEQSKLITSCSQLNNFIQ